MSGANHPAVKLTRPQWWLLKDLVLSPRGGEYCDPAGRPLQKLRALGFIEPVVQGTRLEDWWQATEAGKAYLKSLGSRVP